MSQRPRSPHPRSRRRTGTSRNAPDHRFVQPPWQPLRNPYPPTELVSADQLEAIHDASLTVLEERSVGPGLGADSIEAGKFASAIGLALVMVFMIICYGLFGIFSVIALSLNKKLIVALLSVLQATLTLPGIAGIVLTIGMAVDANVLIYERIREELRNGRTPVTAIDSGFRTAMSTIIDANLTTLIAAIVLFSLGSGPVKGFAVTLAIGLITSMFTAVFVTRAIVVTWLRRTRPKALPI